jgi:hypothetical protein
MRDFCAPNNVGGVGSNLNGLADRHYARSVKRGS